MSVENKTRVKIAKIVKKPAKPVKSVLVEKPVVKKNAPKFKLHTTAPYDLPNKSRTGDLPCMPLIKNMCNVMRNNIVTLKLDRKDIEQLENMINNANNILLDNIHNPLDPVAWDPDNISGCTVKQISEATDAKSNTPNILQGLSSIARNIKQTTKKKIAEDRKNLIINAGVKRDVTSSIHVTGEKWPNITDIACMYCCHRFDTTPVGIPYAIINNKFMCYGNFCSYNCAKRYLCPCHDDEDDMAAIQSYNDLYVGDEQGEKLQLLELLYHIETGAPIVECIKPAPKRLVLKLWGGNKTIEEYRSTFSTNTTFHVFKTPIASMGYQIEECTSTRQDGKRTLRNLSLDVDRLDRARQELLKVKNNLRKELNVRH